MSAPSTTVPVGTTEPSAWAPYPIEEVEAGDPAAELAAIRTESHDGRMLYVGMWRAQPSRFRYAFAGDESFHVLEGRVTITVDGGDAVALGPGSIVSFSKGMTSTWEIHEAVTKFFALSA